ncbi:DUF2264 domain-containing protein [Streptomyces radicis]|uniref:DUF2264 domain-containing protein n=1 Tax=Streptomyces radicis TaxID=1750517 RepID=A0A3A9X1X3_9ACTN|nr:DUF2264 domain-containing protein [Streptomyces radicis]RKN12497.1 DUF2264 domain-containing protein [Streptomyces radicis]RKN27735.1 DUF2264 domain-containing protein [Streptomyces radicis]
MFPPSSSRVAPADGSPITGLTRGDWERAAGRLLDAVRPHAVPGHSLIHLPGPTSGSGRLSDGLEGYARTFLLAAYRSAHAGRHLADHVLAPYAEGLEHGTDPTAPGRWPLPAELPQARVEAAAVAIGLHESRHRLWDRLPDRVRQRTVDWLGGISDTEVPPNNWLWFKAVVAAFLRSVGAPHSTGDIARAVERTEEWYAGGGWYTDGARGPGQRRNFDHYNGWAMHLFPLWYCRISGGLAEPELLPRYRERLRAFLDDAAHLVAGNGAPLFQGRSLIYRFGAAAPFFVGALFDATPLAPGLTRRAGSGMLRYFIDRGAAEEKDVLSLGWHARFPPIRQNYSGPASPYWASQAFAGLLLPPEHPVWTAPEERLPVERGDFTRSLAAPGWLVSGTASDGVIRVVNHGTDHTPPDRPARDDPFYARLAYSTHTAPDLGLRPDLSGDPQAHPRDGDARAPQGPDNRVSLVDGDGALSHRSPLRRVLLAEGVAVSAHTAHWPVLGEPDRERWPAGPAVLTASLVHGPWEVRLVRVAEGTGHPVVIGGHALAAERPPEVTATDDRVVVTRPDGLTSALVVLHPPSGDAALSVRRATAVNAFGTFSATPVYEAGGTLHATAVFLGTTRDAALPPPPEVRLTAGSATVSWPDGTTGEVALGS